MTDSTWTHVVRLHELGRGAVSIDLAARSDDLASIARQLKIPAVRSLSAKVTVKPWLDGAEVLGRLRAVVEQICSVSLEPFDQDVDAEFDVRVVPAGSPHAATAEGGELELDPDAADPPDVLTGDGFDLAAYVVEHLALELDPFPRKPGVEFDYAPPQEETSPFAALKALQARKNDD